jgi:hypothetical protein
MRKRPPFDITVRATQEIRIAKGKSHPGIMEAIIGRIAGEYLLLFIFIVVFPIKSHKLHPQVVVRGFLYQGIDMRRVTDYTGTSQGVKFDALKMFVLKLAKQYRIHIIYTLLLPAYALFT